MKILCYDPPYSGLSSYVSGDKASGLNRDMSQQDESCMEIMSHFFGTASTTKQTFGRIAVAAQLISDDISVFEPDKYIPSDDQVVETIILGAMGEMNSILRNAPENERIEFYSSTPIKMNMAGRALERSLEIFSGIWPNIEKTDKEAVASRILDALDAYYPIRVFDAVNSDALFLSSDPFANKAHAMKTDADDLSAEKILAILATSGIEIALPRIYSRDPDVIAEIKERFSSERLDYIAYLRGFLKECHLAIKAGNYRDAWQFAQYSSTNDLLVKLHNFESAVAQSDKKLLSTAATSISGKGVSIFQSVLSGNWVGAGWEVMSSLIASLNGGTERSKAKAEYRMVSYAFHIKESAN